jgi:hypothetical protein
MRKRLFYFLENLDQSLGCPAPLCRFVCWLTERWWEDVRRWDQEKYGDQ